MSPRRLLLKMFATVVLMRNVDPNKGLCNGTRLIIRAFSNRVIDAEIEIATGIHKHMRIFIPRIILTSSESELPFISSRRQFPIRLAYCITITKGKVRVGKLLVYICHPLKPFLAMVNSLCIE